MTIVKTISKSMKDSILYGRLFAQDWKAGRDLHKSQDNLKKIGPKDIILFTCLRNEKLRMPFFVDYYRRLGVKHFIVVDNGSTDGFQEWAREQPDMSVWHTQASYKASNFGMLWLNDLLRRHGRGHWCVVVDPDEFLVYPNMETRSLRGLSLFLEEEQRHCMHAVMLDAYSDRPLSQTILEEGQDPFEVCPFIDRDGYIQTSGWGQGTWIRGGPRLRTQFHEKPNEAPALNKIPFVHWRWDFHYNKSMHDAYPFMLNRAHSKNGVSPSAALFHFKMVASLAQKAAEELARREHYAGGREYERYAASKNAEFYEPGVSVRYENPQQLVELGLMSPGKWF